MARLVIDAVTAEWTSGDVWATLLLAASVSRADTGAPVTGLAAVNFRLTSLNDGVVLDYKVGSASEGKWEPLDSTQSGCYRLDIKMEPSQSFPSHEFLPGKRYVFGLQARTFNSSQQVVDQGQTVLEVVSVGK